MFRVFHRFLKRPLDCDLISDEVGRVLRYIAANDIFLPWALRLRLRARPPDFFRGREMYVQQERNCTLVFMFALSYVWPNTVAPRLVLGGCMMKGRRKILPIFVTWLLALACAQSLPGQDERIVTQEEVKKAAQPGWLLPLHIISYPHHLISSGMERGLISVEKHRLRERWQIYLDALRRRGILPVFGGTGEGTGFGGGLTYLAGAEKKSQFRMDLNITTTNYEEFDLSVAEVLGPSKLYLEGSYQWRPQENFYGLGHSSLEGQRTNFALRQTWTGVRYEVVPVRWVQAGTEYKWAWLTALPGTNPAFSSPDVYFPNLPGFGTQTRLQSVGTYLALNALRREYQLGGSLHLGASYQKGLGRSNLLKYYSYEIQMEGRLPLASERSALVGQANLEFTRRSANSDPIPFYLLPHIGGSSTLRGFRLDRFYGTNLFLLSLEYRYRLHPNLQAIPFFDEGQIFDQTSDLTWLNWHRNYGLAFRYRAGVDKGTVVRVEFGHSSEGFQFHVSFGDRVRPPLWGPIRYGAYKR